MKKRSALGFLLLENMIALFIISITFLALIKLQTYYVGTNDIAKQRTQALAFSQARIDSFRAYDVITTGNGIFAYDDIQNGTDVLNAENTVYQRIWTVTDNTVWGYKTVLVNVTWSGIDGTMQSVSLSSVIGKEDVKGSLDILLP